MIAHAVIQGGLAGTRTTPVPDGGGSAGSGGGLVPAEFRLVPGAFGLVSLIVASSSVGCDIPAWP
jgi:hypothetical protein